MVWSRGDGDSVNHDGYSSYNFYDPRYTVPPPPPRRSSAQPPYRSEPSRRPRWPPSPSVEDEKAALAREVSSAGSGNEESSGEAKSRGTVDQYPIIEEIEQPRFIPDFNDERRFVLVSEPSANGDPASPVDPAKERRRKSFAERGNMAHLRTDVDDPLLFTKRTSTPYAYTKGQKESTAPSGAEYFLSPEPITPSASSIPRTVPKRGDQNAKPSTPLPAHSRYDSFTQSPRTPKNDVFEDSDSDDTTYLRAAERKPARYSFKKSDLQREDLRTNLLDSQARTDARTDRRRPDPPPRQSSTRNTHSGSSGSSKNGSPRSESPRSSTSSLNNGSSSSRQRRPPPLDGERLKSSRQYSDSRHSRPASPLRPSSPLHRERPPSPPRSPKLPPRHATDSYSSSSSNSRPPSRTGPLRPGSPLSSSYTQRPASPRIPISEADWHATYPPTVAPDRSRPPSRFGRHDTMPVPVPRVDVQSPSPARPPHTSNPLPYPVDDRPTDVFMPPEEKFQFQHSYPPPPPDHNLRQQYPDSPKLSQSPIPGSPRERPSSTFQRPPVAGRHSAVPEEFTRKPRTRSDSMRSQTSVDGRRSDRRDAALNLNRPMPSCPRSTPSADYDDWYTLDSCPDFDICPTCYNGVFADTQFADYFTPVHRYDQRFCDFSTAWMRLAWLLTIKQKRKELDLMYKLTAIADVESPCPQEHELSNVVWYGIPDQRDGIHVTNFAICTRDLKFIESLFPTIRGYFTRLPSRNAHGQRQSHMCSLRRASKRFPKYLDLLVDLDETAQRTGRAPDISRFVTLAREHAFKAECLRDRHLTRRPWHFIPSLPEFTVCEECYDELIYPAANKRNAVAKLFGRTTQLVIGELNEGTACCLYSPRMRRVWERVLEDEDFGYLKRKAMDRKRADVKLGQEKKDLATWLENMSNARSGTYRSEDFERLRRRLREVEEEWKGWE
ncbi:hypothetical protein K491DRAFT_426001 [Lophiostoma macrostomum CBS 122681]|uniref:Uncharacterized protein n=1 Tax=Lophiostoma macrostomum CBS 122681 TaxID=1314788 RepID=A0A6A6T6P6_9PLEO|nr:hypothetical protein K491DRAFT_426001 [Lophiostoma macrostomum CBS 122681]